MLRRYAGALALVAVGFLCGSLHADDKDDAKVQKVKKLLHASGAYDNAQAQYEAMMQQFAANPAFSKALIKKIRSMTKPEDLVELAVPAYVKHLDDDALDGIIAFYESAPGKKLAAAQPKIQKDSMAAGMKWGRETTLKAIEELKADENKKKSDDDDDEDAPAPKKKQEPEKKKNDF